MRARGEESPTNAGGNEKGAATVQDRMQVPQKIFKKYIERPSHPAAPAASVRSRSPSFTFARQRIPRRWNHAACVLLRPDSSARNDDLGVHPLVCRWFIYFSLLLSHNPRYAYSMIWLSVCLFVFYLQTFPNGLITDFAYYEQRRVSSFRNFLLGKYLGGEGNLLSYWVGLRIECLCLLRIHMSRP